VVRGERNSRGGELRVLERDVKGLIVSGEGRV